MSRAAEPLHRAIDTSLAGDPLAQKQWGGSQAVPSDPKHECSKPSGWVGEAGLEPAASSSRTTRATKLRYSPSNEVRSPKSNVQGPSRFRLWTWDFGPETTAGAEGEGFEPPEPFDSADFESAALDQTMRPLRAQLY